mmetsp:Transcript_47722/g.134740  ORF Transcript_47722/g.134740 Transcript_47722/m.134740 type:complete len:252 (-) Transcript_47722:589-1344(-)
MSSASSTHFCLRFTRRLRHHRVFGNCSGVPVVRFARGEQVLEPPQRLLQLLLHAQLLFAELRVHLRQLVLEGAELADSDLAVIPGVLRLLDHRRFLVELVHGILQGVRQLLVLQADLGHVGLASVVRRQDPGVRLLHLVLPLGAALLLELDPFPGGLDVHGPRLGLVLEPVYRADALLQAPDVLVAGLELLPEVLVVPQDLVGVRPQVLVFVQDRLLLLRLLRELLVALHRDLLGHLAHDPLLLRLALALD